MVADPYAWLGEASRSVVEGTSVSAAVVRLPGLCTEKYSKSDMLRFPDILVLTVFGLPPVLEEPPPLYGSPLPGATATAHPPPAPSAAWGENKITLAGTTSLLAQNKLIFRTSSHHFGLGIFSYEEEDEHCGKGEEE